MQVAWCENNTGSKGVSDRIPTVDLQNSNNAQYCEGGECLDQILVDQLRDHLKDVNDNATIVLHEQAVTDHPCIGVIRRNSPKSSNRVPHERIFRLRTMDPRSSMPTTIRSSILIIYYRRSSTS